MQHHHALNTIESDQYQPPKFPELTPGDVSSKIHHGELAGPGDAIDMVGDMDMEAFMNEEVGLLIHTSPNEEDLEYVSLCVNGVIQVVKRGKYQTVKRKYVEVLANAYRITFKQIQGAERDDIKYQRRAAPSYPFEVSRDTERGRAWLRTLKSRPI